MRKQFLYSLLFAASVSMLASCGGDDETTTPTTPDACASKTFPVSAGTSDIQLLNFKNATVSGDFTEISTSAGDLLSFAVQITKASGGNRPQKLRVYQSDCVNDQGTQVTFAGQKDVSNDGTIDLRNTDDAQVRNVNYTVPTGMSTIYLTFAVDESGNQYKYKRVKLTVSGSGLINEWSSIELGGNSNKLASRMSSGTGLTYEACNAAANIDYIDITYAVKTTSPYTSYICSNPARFVAPVSLGTSTASCGEDGDLSTAGGKATYFKASTADFAAATDASMGTLTVSSSNNQYIEVTAKDQVFEFLNSDGKKGLIKVTAVNQLNNTAGSITVAVKVQR